MALKFQPGALEDRSFSDTLGLYDGFNNRALYESLLFYPYLDLYLITSGILRKPVWPNGKQFCLVLTHDVDAIGLYSCAETGRKLKYSGFPSTKKELKNTFGSIFEFTRSVASRALGRPDPYHNFEKWLALEDRLGARSTFFFSTQLEGLKQPIFDCLYSLEDRLQFQGRHITVADLVHRIAGENWEVGLHPSILSFRDASILSKQRKVLQEASGRDVESVRQHFLMFDPEATPQAQAEAGFSYDSTYGFNRMVGFRAGTSYPFRFAANGILEIPLAIQDGALFRHQGGMGLDQLAAQRIASDMMKRVQQVGGVLNLLWHPMYYYDRFEFWIETYRNLIQKAVSEGAWIATLGQLGSYWQANCEKDIASALNELDTDDLSKFVSAMKGSS